MLKQKKLIFISILAALSLTMFSFQNCAKPFQVSEFSSESSLDVNSKFPTLQVNLKFANSSSSSSNSKNKISFKSSDNLTTTVVKKSTFSYNRPQPLHYFSRNFSHNINDKSNRFDPYKLLVQMKDKQGQLIYEQIVNNPSAVRKEIFDTDGKIEEFDNLTRASFDLNLNLPDIAFTSQLEIYEMKGLKAKKIASFEYNDLKSENKILDIKLPLNKQAHQKMLSGVEFQVKLYNLDKSLTLVNDTDPVNDKINILILSDGFMISEMDKFRQNAKDMVDALFIEEPFKSKRNSFNVYFFEVPSRQSCIKKSPDDPCDSALKSYFPDPTSRALMPDHQSVYSYINGFFNSSLVYTRTFQGVIANTSHWGGTGGSIFTQSISPSGPAVFVHEFAHSFGGLGDEYEVYYNVPALDADFQAVWCEAGGYIAGIGQYKNISNSDNKNSLPQFWQDFLNSNGNNVGLFEGAGYCPKNRWRPCADSKMRTIGADWCPVHIKVLDNHIKSFGVTSDHVDSTPPDIVTFQIPATSFSRTISNVNLSASDNIQVIGYMMTENQTPPSSSASGWSANPPTSFTFSGSGSGNLTAYAWAKDAAGNISTYRAAQVSVSIFTETYQWFAPAFPACPAVSNFSYGTWSDCSAQGQKNRTKTCVVASVTQTRTPVCRNSTNQVVANSMCSNSSAPVSTQNCSSACSAPVIETETCTPPVQIDRISPVVNIFQMPATSTSRTISNITLSATDNIQVTGYMMTENQTPPSSSASGWSANPPTTYTFSGSGSGNVTAYAWAKDAAGNVSASKSGVVQITVNTSVVACGSAQSIPNGSQLTCFCSDTQTIATGTIWGTSTYTHDSAICLAAVHAGAIPRGRSGQVTLTRFAGCSSYAGTTQNGVSSSGYAVWGGSYHFNGFGSATCAPSVQIDILSPIVNSFQIPATSNSSTINITVSASDNVQVTGYMMTENQTPPSSSASGWSATPPTSFTFSDSRSGILAAYAWAKDAAGNVSNSMRATVKITLNTPASATISLSATSCTIPIGSSRCSVIVSGSVSNLGIGKLAYISHFKGSPEVFNFATEFPASGSHTFYANVENGSNIFSVRENFPGGPTLVTSSTVIGSCASGSHWDTSSSRCKTVAVANTAINGQCNTPASASSLPASSLCVTGTAYNGSGELIKADGSNIGQNSDTFFWSCYGVNGGTSTSLCNSAKQACSENIFIPKDGIYNLNCSNVKIYGANGAESLVLADSSTNLKADANIENVTFPKAFSNYKFSSVQGGLGFNVLEINSNLVINFPSLNQELNLKFSDKTVTVTQQAGGVFKVSDGSPVYPY